MRELQSEYTQISTNGPMQYKTTGDSIQPNRTKLQIAKSHYKCENSSHFK